MKTKDKTFKVASFSNKSKELHFEYQSNKSINLHYANFGITQLIKTVWIDKETRGKSIGLELTDGTVDYIPYDQPLAIIGDPDYLLQNHIERIIARIKLQIKDRKISKRYLARTLNTSDNQIHRLLNPKILSKNLSQLYQICNILELEIELNIKDVA